MTAHAPYMELGEAPSRGPSPTTSDSVPASDAPVSPLVELPESADVPVSTAPVSDAVFASTHAVPLHGVGPAVLLLQPIAIATANEVEAEQSRA
jgi:hypothetical protein